MKKKEQLPPCDIPFYSYLWWDWKILSLCLSTVYINIRVPINTDERMDIEALVPYATSICCRVSQPWQYWHLEPDNSLGGLPCVLSSARSSAPGPYAPIAFPYLWQPKTSLDIATCPLATNVPFLVEKHCSTLCRNCVVTGQETKPNCKWDNFRRCLLFWTDRVEMQGVLCMQKPWGERTWLVLRRVWLQVLLAGKVDWGEAWE